MTLLLDILVLSTVAMVGPFSSHTSRRIVFTLIAFGGIILFGLMRLVRFLKQM